jgi:hypothetical protein
MTTIYHTPVAAHGHIEGSLAPYGPVPHFAIWQLGTNGYSDNYAAPLVLPPSGHIISVAGVVHGNIGQGAPHASLPEIKPRISLYRQSVLEDGMMRTLVTEEHDSHDSVASYEQWHRLVIETDEEITPARTWWAVVSGEGGAGALPMAWCLADIIAEVVPA